MSASDNSPSGELIIVSTPIGNLGDLSQRAIDTLSRVDIVACEDTRHSGRLLAHLGIRRRLISLHEHNERHRVPQLLGEIEQGRSVALISDAGTPLLADPGFVLVREAIARGLAVGVVPGPSASLAALALSGLPPYPFTFVGFPPPKSGKRRRFYRRFAELDHTLIIFESPHRLGVSLRDLLEEMGDRPCALAREITKLHEEVLRGPLSEILETVDGRDSLKGEFVVVVGPAPDQPAD